MAKIVGLVTMLVALSSCSAYRYDYLREVNQQEEKTAPSLQTTTSARYQVPDSQTLTNQLPYSPDTDRRNPLNRPVPMHVTSTFNQTSLVGRSVATRSTVELTDNFYMEKSLRLTLPVEVVASRLEEILSEKKWQFNKNITVGDTCSVNYEVLENSSLIICLYNTLEATYVVPKMEDEESESEARQQGNELLQTLEKRLNG